MFKIDRRKALSFFGACMLVSSLGLGACSSQKSNENKEHDLLYVSTEEASNIAVYNKNDVSIIIPFSSSYKGDNGSILLDVGDYIDGYGYSEVVIFGGDDCYNRALNFASAISDEVYLYKDVMNGNPVNLHDDIENTSVNSEPYDSQGEKVKSMDF